MNSQKLIRSSIGLVLFVILMSGCTEKKRPLDGNGSQTEQSRETDIVYISNTPPSDCQLCGNGKGTLLPAYWGEDNIGIIDLNTFQLSHISINEYDDHGRRIKNGFCGSSFNTLNTGEEGMSVWGNTDSNRGYYSGQACMKSRKGLELEKVSKFLCTGCLNTMLDQCHDETYFNLGIVNFSTKEIRLLEKCMTAVVFDDFYVDCDYFESEEPENSGHGFNLLIFYCPPRYER